MENTDSLSKNNADGEEEKQHQSHQPPLHNMRGVLLDHLGDVLFLWKTATDPRATTWYHRWRRAGHRVVLHPCQAGARGEAGAGSCCGRSGLSRGVGVKRGVGLGLLGLRNGQRKIQGDLDECLTFMMTWCTLGMEEGKVKKTVMRGRG